MIAIKFVGDAAAAAASGGVGTPPNAPPAHCCPRNDAGSAHARAEFAVECTATPVVPESCSEKPPTTPAVQYGATEPVTLLDGVTEGVGRCDPVPEAVALLLGVQVADGVEGLDGVPDDGGVRVGVREPEGVPCAVAVVVGDTDGKAPRDSVAVIDTVGVPVDVPVTVAVGVGNWYDQLKFHAPDDAPRPPRTTYRNRDGADNTRLLWPTYVAGSPHDNESVPLAALQANDDHLVGHPGPANSSAGNSVPGPQVVSVSAPLGITFGPRSSATAASVYVEYSQTPAHWSSPTASSQLSAPPAAGQSTADVLPVTKPDGPDPTLTISAAAKQSLDADDEGVTEGVLLPEGVIDGAREPELEPEDDGVRDGVPARLAESERVLDQLVDRLFVGDSDVDGVGAGDVDAGAPTVKLPVGEFDGVADDVLVPLAEGVGSTYDHVSAYEPLAAAE